MVPLYMYLLVAAGLFSIGLSRRICKMTSKMESSEAPS